MAASSSMEGTSIISPQLASQYKQHLKINKDWKGEELTPAKRNEKLLKLKQYKETLAPKWQQRLAEDLSSIEAKVAAEADRVIENDNKNHAESMGSMEHIKTMLKESELSILQSMKQKMMPLPNQVEMVGILMKKNSDCLKRMCVQAGCCSKGTKIERAQRLSALGSEHCMELLSKEAELSAPAEEAAPQPKARAKGKAKAKAAPEPTAAAAEQEAAPEPSAAAAEQEAAPEPTAPAAIKQEAAPEPTAPAAKRPRVCIDLCDDEADEANDDLPSFTLSPVIKPKVEEPEEHELIEQESEAEQVNKPDQFIPNAEIASRTASPTSPAGSDAVEPTAAAAEQEAAPEPRAAAAEQQQDWGWALRSPHFKGRDRLCGTFARRDDGFYYPEENLKQQAAAVEQLMLQDKPADEQQEQQAPARAEQQEETVGPPRIKTSFGRFKSQSDYIQHLVDVSERRFKMQIDCKSSGRNEDGSFSMRM